MNLKWVLELWNIKREREREACEVRDLKIYGLHGRLPTIKNTRQLHRRQKVIIAGGGHELTAMKMKTAECRCVVVT